MSFQTAAQRRGGLYSLLLHRGCTSTPRGHFDDPTQCKIYAPDRRGWFTMPRASSADPLRPRRSRSARSPTFDALTDGAKGGNGPTEEPQEEGETTDSIEDLLRPATGEIWACRRRATTRRTRGKFYVGDNMGSIERRVKLTRWASTAA